MKILKRFHVFLLAVLMVGWAFDSMNSGLISGTLTLIIRDLELTSEEAGRVLSSWLLGMLIGAFALGFIGDRIGRKWASIIALAFMGLFSWASLAATWWLDLSLYRLLAGVGAAGYMVVASTLLAEYSPAEVRGGLIALLESAWAFGWLIALLLARIIAPSMGWRSVFNSSLMTLALIPVIVAMVPESIRFLVSRGKVGEAEKIIAEARLDVDISKIKRGERASLSELFKGVYLRRTVMLWIHWFCIVLAYWGIFLWLPHILYARGISYIKSLQYSLLITLAQIPGYWSAAALIDKIGRKKVLASYMALAGVGSLLFWTAVGDFEALLWASVISFFNLGAWGVTYAYTPELYPTRLRTTASGWANSIGRIGGILGPYIAGLLIQTTGDPLYPFILFASVHFISAITIAILGEETKKKELEEISK